MMAPQENAKAHEQYYKDIAIKWAETLRSGTLHKYDVIPLIKTTVMKSLEYPMTLSTLGRSLLGVYHLPDSTSLSSQSWHLPQLPTIGRTGTDEAPRLGHSLILSVFRCCTILTGSSPPLGQPYLRWRISGGQPAGTSIGDRHVLRPAPTRLFQHSHPYLGYLVETGLARAGSPRRLCGLRVPSPGL